MEELVKDYEEQVESPPPEPFVPTPCDDIAGSSSMEFDGHAEAIPLSPPPTLPVQNPDFWKSFYADDAEPTTTDGIPLDFSLVFAADDTEDEGELREAELAVGAFMLHGSDEPANTAETADPVPSHPVGGIASDATPDDGDDSK